MISFGLIRIGVQTSLPGNGLSLHGANNSKNILYLYINDKSQFYFIAFIFQHF